MRSATSLVGQLTLLVEISYRWHPVWMRWASMLYRDYSARMASGCNDKAAREFSTVTSRRPTPLLFSTSRSGCQIAEITPSDVDQPHLGAWIQPEVEHGDARHARLFRA